MGRKGSDNSGAPSNNLWVGNVSENATDSDLLNLFSKHGAVDSVAAYPSRNYAFVYYKRVEDAKTAIKALGGALFFGKNLKIEFAKPAKPCKSLWVSGVSPAVTKEMLEEEFMKFGKIEELKIIRDRNTAYIDYSRLEDAVKASKNLKGKQIGGDQIRVDFLRSNPIKRDQLADHPDAKEGQFLNRATSHVITPFMRHESLRNYYEPTHSGTQGQNYHSYGGKRGDGPPTNVLLICYPTNVEIDDHRLHNAMILFGEIESLKSFPAQHCAFVEFRSMDEARRAKEGLQGRLFNDPRIIIVYSNKEHAPGENHPEIPYGLRGPRSNMYNSVPFQPAHSEIPNAGTELKDLIRHHKLQDANDKSILGAPSWRRTSPAPGILPSPSGGTKRPNRPGFAPRGALDDQLPGEFKRSRIDAALPFSNYPFPLTKTDDPDLESNRFSRHGSRASRDVQTGGASRGSLDKDYIWRGLIAKGGNPVCRARCVPIGEGIDSEIPEVVNCSARTGLDMLTKHYADASGFDIVFFLPDCEEDFASYTEFLNYLGAKDRAGVARFDNGTTLFLVPPSDFLTDVLKIVGPPRLYGVVLKFPQDAPENNSSHSQSFVTSNNVDRQQGPSQGEYSGFPKSKEALAVDHGKATTLSGITPPSSAPKMTALPVASMSTALVSQAGVTLSPDLIASLTSLLPANSNPSVALSAPLPPGRLSSMRHPSLAGYESEIKPLQGWTPDRQDLNQTPHYSRQAQQYNPLAQQQVAQYQNHKTGLNMPYNPVLGVSAKGHVQNSPYYQPQRGGVSGPLSSFGIKSQIEQHTVSSQYSHRHPNEVVQNTPFGFPLGQGNNSTGSYGSSVYPLVPRSDILPGSVHGYDTQPAQVSMVTPADKENPVLLNKVQQHPTVDGGTSQDTSGVEVDKNQRYQSTLEFAANLLFQIQQQQQQQQTASELAQRSTNNK